jgi:hypothetical protein
LIKAKSRPQFDGSKLVFVRLASDAHVIIIVGDEGIGECAREGSCLLCRNYYFVLKKLIQRGKQAGEFGPTTPVMGISFCKARSWGTLISWTRTVADEVGWAVMKGVRSAKVAMGLRNCILLVWKFV